MITVETLRGGRLMIVRYAGHVGADEVLRSIDEIRELLRSTDSGFTLLTDLSGLEAMEAGCATAIGDLMELCDREGLASAVRVIPDPQRDIGFALISRFHQLRSVRVQTYESMEEALAGLELQ